MIFQDYSRTVTCVSNNSLRKSIAGVNLVYSKIREEILTNPLGIVNEKGVVRATRKSDWRYDLFVAQFLF